MNDLINTEVLIIGSGIAGGTAALQLADAGIPVTVVTRRRDFSSSNTYYAQGGIVYEAENDSVDQFCNDVIRAGAGHSNPEMVRLMAGEGPDLVRNILIDKLGIQFDRDEQGKLSLVREGGHSLPRILHVTDATGKAIEQALVERLRNHEKVQVLTNITAVDILTPAHHSLNRQAVYAPSSCVGAYLLDQSEGKVFRCIARKTILATGGLGQIFLRTTNPPGSRGDGIAMAYRAGARVINSEFVQFHPTIFYHEYKPTFLISEAVRGAGARLVDENGTPFMQKYSADWKDLAPRDVVSSSIHKEMTSKGVSNVFLDMHSYIPADKIKSEFPNIYQKCNDFGIDPVHELIPVVPAAHYACGGLWVDEWGRTTIRHFYAVGEVACTGVHGANRLASTSLLEGLVWGHRAALNIADTIKNTSLHPATDIPGWEDAGLETPDPALINQDMTSIKNIMWNYVGLVRTTHRLQRALRELRNLENEIERFYRVTRLTDSLLGLRNAVRTAIIVTVAAWENRRSMGCHNRE